MSLDLHTAKYEPLGGSSHITLPDIEKRFDNSDYPTDHPSGIKRGLNSKVLGMFNDGAGGKQIVEFVGFRAKLYSYKMLDGSDDKNCKEVTKNITKRSIQFDDYRECLLSRKEQHRKMNGHTKSWS